MGQYAGAGALANREDLAAFADELFRGLWSERWDSELGVSWGYSAPNPFWNDAVHAAYVGLGMAVYARHRPGLELNAEATRRYLQSFVRESFVSEFAPNAKLKAKFIRPSPASGSGMLMSALAELGDCETAQAISRRLGAYRRSDFRFGYLPDDRTYYPRAHAHVVLGLATLERGCRSERAGAH